MYKITIGINQQNNTGNIFTINNKYIYKTKLIFTSFKVTFLDR